jgi:hypothetical protein
MPAVLKAFFLLIHELQFPQWSSISLSQLQVFAKSTFNLDPNLITSALFSFAKGNIIFVL